MRRLLALLVVAASAGASAGAPDDGPGDAVVAAIRAAGGYVDHRQEIVELAPGYRGVVARRAIDAGAVLARIPWSGLLAAEGTCPLALALADKLRAEDAAPDFHRRPQPRRRRRRRGGHPGGVPAQRRG